MKDYEPVKAQIRGQDPEGEVGINIVSTKPNHRLSHVHWRMRIAPEIFGVGGAPPHTYVQKAWYLIDVTTQELITFG